MGVKKSRYLKLAPGSILFLVIWVTNKCNLRCKMCNQWKMDPAVLFQELSTQEWYSVIDSAVRMHTAVISLTGGEPLLRPDIFEIIDYIRKRGIACHLCTNGTMLNEATVDGLKHAKPNSISVSLDSDRAELHNALRGVDCFNTVVRGIKLLRQTIPEISIGINYLITRKNFHNMARMISFAEKLGANQVKFAPIHTNLMYKYKEPSSFGGLLFTEDDLPELQVELNKLIYAISQTKLYTNSRSFIKGILNLYNGEYRKLPCYAGYVSCVIDPLGEVFLCCGIDGNESVRNKPLEEIWKSSSFQKLRNQVHNCKRDCWDTTNTELNIRCSVKGFIEEFSQVLKDIRFYFS